MNFKNWLENRLDPWETNIKLNMTRQLRTGAGKAGPVSLASLDRKFHVNTVIGRLYGHWHVQKVPKTGKPYMSHRFDLDSDQPNPYRNEDGTPTKKYWAAYKVWQDYIKDIVASIGEDTLARDVNTGKDMDFLKPTRDVIGKGQHGKDIVKSVKTAAAIDAAARGPLAGKNRPGAARDYANLMELLADIFEDPAYEEASRDFYEIGSGSRTMPAEDIEEFLSKHGGTELQGPQM